MIGTAADEGPDGRAESRGERPCRRVEAVRTGSPPGRPSPELAVRSCSRYYRRDRFLRLWTAPDASQVAKAAPPLGGAAFAATIRSGRSFMGWSADPDVCCTVPTRRRRNGVRRSHPSADERTERGVSPGQRVHAGRGAPKYQTPPRAVGSLRQFPDRAHRPNWKSSNGMKKASFRVSVIASFRDSCPVLDRASIPQWERAVRAKSCHDPGCDIAQNGVRLSS